MGVPMYPLLCGAISLMNRAMNLSKLRPNERGKKTKICLNSIKLSYSLILDLYVYFLCISVQLLYDKITSCFFTLPWCVLQVIPIFMRPDAFFLPPSSHLKDKDIEDIAHGYCRTGVFMDNRETHSD